MSYLISYSWYALILGRPDIFAPSVVSLTTHTYPSSPMLYFPLFLPVWVFLGMIHSFKHSLPKESKNCSIFKSADGSSELFSSGKEFPLEGRIPHCKRHLNWITILILHCFMKNKVAGLNKNSITFQRNKLKLK